MIRALLKVSKFKERKVWNLAEMVFNVLCSTATLEGKSKIADSFKIVLELDVVVIESTDSTEADFWPEAILRCLTFKIAAKEGKR